MIVNSDSSLGHQTRRGCTDIRESRCLSVVGKCRLQSSLQRSQTGLAIRADSQNSSSLDDGRSTIDSHEYSVLINRYHRNVGRLLWAAPQDWMCEPIVIHGGVAGGQKFVGTGLSVREHQQRTVANFLELDGYCQVPIIPVIQGFTIDEYHECIEMYSDNGIDLTKYPTVGVGSICRRQATQEACDILRSICQRGINIHGFGLKREALRNVLCSLASADSMAWSFNARHAGTTCGKINERTGEPIKNCANCYHAAVEWYEKTMSMIGH